VAALVALRHTWGMALTGAAVLLAFWFSGLRDIVVEYQSSLALGQLEPLPRVFIADTNLFSRFCHYQRDNGIPN
jgi:hypothetical protein